MHMFQSIVVVCERFIYVFSACKFFVYSLLGEHSNNTSSFARVFSCIDCLGCLKFYGNDIDRYIKYWWEERVICLYILADVYP